MLPDILASRRTFLKKIALAVGMLAMPSFMTGCASFRRIFRPADMAWEIWPLEKKIGQMLIPGFPGSSISENSPVASHIRDYGAGGVVLFDNNPLLQVTDRNITSPDQLSELTGELHRLASTPLFIAVDQEGGTVARLKESCGFPPSVSAKKLGLINELSITESEADRIAVTLSSHGINLNLAPVVDLELNPENPVIAGKERSFSADPLQVAAHAERFIKAHHRHNVATCLKHFPGHGSSRSDSHAGLVDVTDVWSEAELVPYSRLISAGLCDMVMTAHIFNRNIDPEYPATLSKATIDGILRKRLLFDGLVISDDLYMGAIARNFSYETAVERAINAGVDMLIIANDKVYEPFIIPRTIDLIMKKVSSGVIKEERINEACRRIISLKRRYLL